MAGFTKPTTTQTPDALFDYWLTRLTAAELRVALYTIRHTFGYQKESDEISVRQYVRGVRRTADKSIVDEGCGLGETAVKKAIKALTTKGLLIKTRREVSPGIDDVNNYRLHLIDYRRAAAGGFARVNIVPVPNELFDYWLTRLSDVELKVLLYIIRRTLGFSKIADVIPRRQFLMGITTHEGTVLDDGCGVSRKPFYLALKSLEEKGLIIVTHRTDPHHGSVAPLICLVFEDQALPFNVAPIDPRTLPATGAPTAHARDVVAGIQTTTDRRAEMTPPGVTNDTTRGHERPQGASHAAQMGVGQDAMGGHERPQGRSGMTPTGGAGYQRGGPKKRHRVGSHPTPQQTDSDQEKTRQEKSDQETQQHAPPPPHGVVVVHANKHETVAPDTAASTTEHARQMARDALDAYGVRGDRLIAELVRDPGEVLYQVARLQEEAERGMITNAPGWLVEAIRNRYRRPEDAAAPERDGRALRGRRAQGPATSTRSPSPTMPGEPSLRNYA